MQAAQIEQLTARVAELELALAKAYDELTAAIPRQEQLGSDETSIKDNGKRHWIWCITAAPSLLNT